MDSGRVERILRRGLTVACLVGMAQALVFALGWLLVYERTHEDVARSVEQVIVQSNAAAATAIVDLLGGIPDLDEVGSADWERTQRVIEGLELGGDGFACVLDSAGHIVCHPDMRAQPELRGINLSLEFLRDLDGRPLGTLSSLAPGQVVQGVVDFGLDGKHYLATTIDPDSHAQLLVHQPVSGLTAAGNHVAGPLLESMLAIGALVMLLTVALAVILVRAHDRTMARWNRELEGLVDERTRQLVRSHRAILFGLARLAEYRDSDTGLHVERMCAYSGEIAREHARRFGGIEAAWIEDLELAAAMHDIGKVSIPDSILLKPGKLTPAEFEQMKKHAQVGETALTAIRGQVDDTRLLDLGIEISGGHHERWDGSGYPRGLAGTEIPLSARIVAIADVFDALMSKRFYKAAMPFDEVLEIIREGRGAHFDPDVVDSFEAVAERLRLIHARLHDATQPSSALPHAETRVVEPGSARPGGLAADRRG